ncbi:MAG: cytidine deaminase [Balneolaceae bacterium]
MNWKTLQQNAYTPYSGNSISCIVESKTGKFFTGVRVESITYPLTIPAIQSACCICLSEGEIPAKIYLEDSDVEHLNYWVDEFEMEVLITKNPPADEHQNLFHVQEDDFKSLPKLKELLKKSVTPNSDFPVSAILFVNGGYFEGVNIEVSDWTKGLCAERVAIAKAIAAGITTFLHLDVHTKKGEVSSPCGACRQVILEHLPYHIVKLHHADGTLSEHLTVDLLPFSFKSSVLKK